MMIPLTDRENPYTAMMLDLIAGRKSRVHGPARLTSPARRRRRRVHTRGLVSL